MSADSPSPADGGRVPLALEGRYMIVGANDEHSCTTREMSPVDVVLAAPVAPPPGAKVVLYLNDLGRFTGPVLRKTETGFEMGLELTPQKSDRLAVQLSWRNNLATGKVEEKRVHDRFAPLSDMAILRLSRGKESVARIRSLSLSGVEIETDQFLVVGAEIIIGNTPARVVRLTSRGVGAEFLRPFQPGEIDETTRL